MCKKWSKVIQTLREQRNEIKLRTSLTNIMEFTFADIVKNFKQPNTMKLSINPASTKFIRSYPQLVNIKSLTMDFDLYQRPDQNLEYFIVPLIEVSFLFIYSKFKISIIYIDIIQQLPQLEYISYYGPISILFLETIKNKCPHLQRYSQI